MLTPGINEKAKMDDGRARLISVKYKINSLRREEKYMGDWRWKIIIIIIIIIIIYIYIYIYIYIINII